MALVDTAPALVERQPAQSFFSPMIDFLCLGGGSLLLLPVLALAIPASAHAATLSFAVLLANAINHPHFAYSYQIFYRNFVDVVRNRSLEAPLRARYILAGAVVPALLVVFFVVALSQSDARVLGYGGNAMMFFVGWHYVKQGYGMLMVDAGMKKSFFNGPGKRALLWNAFLCWITAWLRANKVVAGRDLWGIGYATFDIPAPLLSLATVGLVATSLWCIVVLVQHCRTYGVRSPISGIAAYVASLYPWLFLGFQPVLSAVIPAMHSFQYQIIAWRYQLNVENSKADAAQPASIGLLARLKLRRSGQRFAGFCLRGLILGALGFWVVPMTLSLAIPYDRAVFGPLAFMFIFVIFINIHHYFIDNAMWRKENPHTLKHLFAPR